MAGFDGNINVTVQVDQPAVPPAGFGVPLLAATGLGGGFTERFRLYPDAATVAADLAAGDLAQVHADALNTGLLQVPRVPNLAVGRIEPDVAQIDTVTFAGTTALVDEEFTILINGVPYLFVALGGETPAALATALAPLVDADPDVGAVDSGGGIVTITSSVAGNPFTTTVLTDSVGITMTQAIATPNTSIFTELGAVVAENANWYGLHPQSRAAVQLQRAAEWTALNARLMLGQSSDADMLTTATTSIADTLKTADNERAGIVYHADDTEWSAFSWFAKKLAVDLDLSTTSWAYATLPGVTTQTQLTPTELANLLAKNANVYSTLGPSGAVGQGRLANALPIDLRTTADWTQARITENIQNLFLATSDRNDKIPYDDGGIATVGAEIEDVLARGVTAGHFAPKTSVVTLPVAAEVAAATKTARAVTIPFSVLATGAIENAIINGNILTSL